MWRLVRQALVALTAALATTAVLGKLGGYGASGACDDGMGGEDGSDLVKVPLAGQAWAAEHVATLLTEPGATAWFDDIMSWPRDAPPKSRCFLRDYEITKLCVPSDGSMSTFRTKVMLRTTCGDMIVKLRAAVRNATPEVTLWGRSRT